jgi:hypothetical protein
MTETAITVLNPERAIGEVNALYTIMANLYKEVLKPDLDYGIIPGTGGKPTLLLPGMEKLMRALNAVPRYVERRVIVDYDRPLFHYEYECQLIDASSGQFIPGGIGLGLCTSKESAFAWRQANRVCPNCGKEAIIKGKAEYGGGWICFAKKGGCGAKFAEDAPEIMSQQTGRVENPDLFDQVNAIMKRAKKRALGDAVKGAAAVSEFFTVDVEDFVEDEFTPVVDSTPEPPAQEKTPPVPAPDKLHIGKLIETVTPLYDHGKHAANSVNKLVKDGIIKTDMEMFDAIKTIILHRAASDYQMTEAQVLEAIRAVNEDDTIADYAAFLKAGHKHSDVWTAVKEYHTLKNGKPAAPKSEADQFAADHNLTTDAPPVETSIDDVPF